MVGRLQFHRLLGAVLTYAQVGMLWVVPATRTSPTGADYLLIEPGIPGDHTATGLVLLEVIAPRLGLNQADVDTMTRTVLDLHEQHPFDILHTILGTGISAQVLSTVYLFFLAFVPISLGASLIVSINPLPGLWWVLTLGINWTLDVVSYFVIPALGPEAPMPLALRSL